MKIKKKSEVRYMNSIFKQKLKCMRPRLKGNITDSLIDEIDSLLNDHKSNNYIIPQKDMGLIKRMQSMQK